MIGLLLGAVLLLPACGPTAGDVDRAGDAYTRSLLLAEAAKERQAGAAEQAALAEAEGRKANAAAASLREQIALLSEELPRLEGGARDAAVAALQRLQAALAETEGRQVDAEALKAQAAALADRLSEDRAAADARVAATRARLDAIASGQDAVDTGPLATGIRDAGAMAGAAGVPWAGPVAEILAFVVGLGGVLGGGAIARRAAQRRQEAEIAAAEAAAAATSIVTSIEAAKKADPTFDAAFAKAAPVIRQVQTPAAAGLVDAAQA